VKRPLALLVLAVAASSALWRLASRFPLPRRDLGRWLVDVGPADAAMSVVRVAALGAAMYLAVIALLHLVVPTWSRAGRWVSTLTPPSLRAMLVTTVLVTSSAGAAFAGAKAAPPPPVSIALSDPGVIAAPPTVPEEALYTVKAGDSFWSIVYPAFMARDLTRADLRALLRKGLQQASGNYKVLVQLFNMPPDDYKRFLNFLRKHDCHVPFKAFRTAQREPLEKSGIESDRS